MDIANLRFFDKDGYILNFKEMRSIDSPATYSWSGTISFGSISTSLFDNQNIYVLELINGEYQFPQMNVGDKLLFRWTGKDSLQFFVYDVLVDIENNLPYISRNDNFVVEFAPEMISLRYPLEFSVAFNPNWESSFSNTLDIALVEAISPNLETHVATIEFYGEGEEEDERYRVWLENFGIKFHYHDILMVKDYDINEAMPDWEFINTKRKEMLINREEVFPYIGLYRGLVNMIALMGFGDTIRMKEYWKNTVISLISKEGIIISKRSCLRTNTMRFILLPRCQRTRICPSKY